MADPNLREKFAKIREEQETARRAPALEAANKFFNKLADNFVAALEEKVARGDVLDIPPGEKDAEYGPIALFTDPSLHNVTRGEVRAMDGYIRLKEICRGPDVDLCLGTPQFGKWYDDSSVKFDAVTVYISKGYNESEQALWDGAVSKTASGKKKWRPFRHRH